MTPKEKAQELRQEFVFRIEDIIEPKTLDEVESLNTLIYKAAKQCALIAVNEILDNFPNEFWDEYLIDNFKYWGEVKQELENL